MTLREKILKTFAVTIREINTHGGPEKFFEKYPVGGVYYGEAAALQAQYDLVIFNVNAFFVAQWSVPHMLIWASHLFDKKKKLIVNYGSPYFASEYLPEDPTIIEMNTTPTAETVKMLADGIMGQMEFKGKPIISKN